MAAGAFKQACPSCEAMVPIKDASLVGKKVECPKCKYKFAVEKPKDRKPSDDDAKPAPKTGKAGAAAAVKSGKPRVKAPLRDIDDEDDLVPESHGAASRRKLFMGLGLAAIGLVILGLAAYFILLKPSPSPQKSTTPPPKYDDPAPPEDDPKNKKDDTKPEVKKKETIPTKPSPSLTPPGPELTNLLPNDTEHVFHGFFGDLFDASGALRAPVFGERGTFVDDYFRPKLGFSLLAIDDFIRADRFTAPAWTFTVMHFKELINEQAVVEALGLKRQPAIRGYDYYKVNKTNPWFNHLSRLSIGVPKNVQALTPLSDRPLFMRFYSPQTLIFGDELPMQEFLKNDCQFKLLSGVTAPEPKNPDPMAKEPGKDKEKEPVKEPGKEPMPPVAKLRDFLSDTYWEGTETRFAKVPNQTTIVRFRLGEQGGVTMDSPAGTTSGGNYEIKDNKVLIKFGPVHKYEGVLSANNAALTGLGQFEAVLWKFSIRKIKGPTSVVKLPEGKDPVKVPPPVVRSQSYLTVKPNLKAVLDRLEAKSEANPEKVLFSTASEMDKARLTATPAEWRDKFVWRARQVWDPASVLEDRKPRIVIGGNSLLLKEFRAYQYRIEFECAKENDARDLLKDVDEVMAPEIARNLDRYLLLKMDLPRSDTPMTSIDPLEKKEKGVWSSALREPSVDIHLDLTFDGPTANRAAVVTTMLALSSRSSIDLGTDPALRHVLARSAKEMAEQGVSDRKVPPGTYPPGTFRRNGASTKVVNTPYHRMSWMTAMLPYLGHQNLYNRLNADASWRDPSNWLPARVLVPAFQDPTYPESARHVAIPGMGIDPAATHFVGIAGVGLDAAEYRRDDPATVTKRGVFGYDQSATLADIQKGRGLSQTILMIQVPHDGLTGVSPWIAGGGSTLRGVPDTKSIDPFVLSTDKNGQPIAYQGRRGTYAVMTDGSVRFIDKSISDEAFKAMCTVEGPADKLDDEKTLLVADPTPKVRTPEVKTPEVKGVKVGPKTVSPTDVKQPALKKKVD